MNKIIGLISLSGLIAMLSGCATVSDDMADSAENYHGPLDKRYELNRIRPEISHWCENYSYNSQEVRVTCTMVGDAIILRHTLKPTHKWKPDAAMRVDRDLSDWACNPKSPIHHAVQNGLAVFARLDRATSPPVITYEQCMDNKFEPVHRALVLEQSSGFQTMDESPSSHESNDAPIFSPIELN
jgi:hypothetical protein